MNDDIPDNDCPDCRRKNTHGDQCDSCYSQWLQEKDERQMLEEEQKEE